MPLLPRLIPLRYKTRDTLVPIHVRMLKPIVFTKTLGNITTHKLLINSFFLYYLIIYRYNYISNLWIPKDQQQKLRKLLKKPLIVTFEPLEDLDEDNGEK